MQAGLTALRTLHGDPANLWQRWSESLASTPVRTMSLANDEAVQDAEKMPAKAARRLQLFCPPNPRHPWPWLGTPTKKVGAICGGGDSSCRAKGFLATKKGLDMPAI
jgi:hypothetical protein